MDDQRFDDLSRRLARGTSRRQMLRALAGGVLGGVAGSLGFGRAAAACATDRDCPPGERCDEASATCVPRGGRPASQSQSQSVSAAAVCTTDAECAANETCVDGTCAPRGGSCTRGSACTTDATCCGGEVCDTGNGVCVGAGGPCTNTTGTCVDSTDCCGNEECIGGTCQQMAGGCAPGAICTADAECCGGQVCANGTCAQAARPAGCPEGQVRCSGVCVDTLSDPNNCGACGVVCPGGFCGHGNCGFTGTCPEGQDACVDFFTGEGPGCCGVCERCRGGGEGGPLFCAPKCNDCSTCDPLTGACTTVHECSGPCETCGPIDPVTGQPTCMSVCGCGTCGGVDVDGHAICIPMDCGPCANLTAHDDGTCECVSICDACSTCDPIDGCVSQCGDNTVCSEYNGCSCDPCSVYVESTGSCVTGCAPGEVCYGGYLDPQDYVCCPPGSVYLEGQCLPSG